MSVKRLVLLLAGASALAVSGTAKAAHVNLISDGGFESPTLAAKSYTYKPTGTPYTFSPLVSNKAGAGEATAGSGFNVNFAGETSGGSQTGFIQDLGSIAQKFTVVTAGDYTLRFQDEARFAGVGDTFQVSIAKGNSNLVFPASGGAYDPTLTSFTTVSESPISLAAGTYTLKFLGLDGAIPGVAVGGGDRTSYIDNVSLTAVPLPSSVLAGGAFLGVIGLAKWRNRSRTLA